MINEQPTNEKDAALWELAKKRASFKTSLSVYVIVNVFLWALWFFTNDNNYGNNVSRLPWPIWPTLGWGVGIAFQYFGAYIAPKSISVENEYQKLKKK
jgi:predicted membrane protein